MSDDDVRVVDGVGCEGGRWMDVGTELLTLYL